MSPPETANAPKPMRLLDQVRDKLRKLHYSPRTEEAYVGWIKRYIWFHGKRLRIPRLSGHRFHGKLDTQSAGNWTLIPGQPGHRFQGKLDT